MTATRIAFLFPGQGSQSAGMGRDLALAYPAAAAVFEEADSILGFSLSKLCFEGSDADLKPTEVAQPALLACGIAALRCVQAAGVIPAATAGHSLGEYSALTAAGVFPFSEALRLVRRRSLLMAEAAKESPGAMAAILGLDAPAVEQLCISCDDAGVVTPANFNAPGQVVVSGSVEGVAAAVERARAAGASRAITLAVSGAFHSPLMRSAARAMADELAAAPMSRAAIAVVSNTTARPTEDPEELRAALVAQIDSGVRWEQSVKALDELGISHYLELGPGKVLCGLVRKIVPGAAVHNVGDSGGMAGLSAFLEG